MMKNANKGENIKMNKLKNKQRNYKWINLSKNIKINEKYRKNIYRHYKSLF